MGVTSQNHGDDTRKRNNRSGLYAALLVAGMLALGYASVPLYRIFCQVTGFAGTTQVANAAEAETVQIADTTISVRFDSNVSSALPWTFRPEHVTDTVSVGARDMAIFLATNNSDQEVTGNAVFNVTPLQAGKYFNKVQCFCFTEQTLRAHQTARMPVLYYVDPAILDDPDTKDIKEITLSYTFYPVDQGKKGG